MSHLVILMNGIEAGRLDYEKGRLSLTYAPQWRERPGATPVSLSMPLTGASYSGAAVGAFVWGLLPDNEQVIQEWARRFQVSARQPFGLIGAVGEDCAGAVQFVAPARLAAVLDGEADGVDWLTERQVGERLAGLRTNRGAWRRAGDGGQFSLAGAQPKIALIQQNGQWGIPRGRIPTTHILKPPSADLEAQAENEHFCLSVLGRLGLPVAQSSVQTFEGEVAIVVERYDRLATATGVARIHQEDFCQALGVLPDRKYQNEGGPGLRDILDLLRVVSSAPKEDIESFVDAAIFNWMIGGSDAHAKNFSLLHAGGGRARLAPIYDVASILPYAPQVQFQDVKLAMKIGGEYRLGEIGLRRWAGFAKENRIDFEQVRDRIGLMADKLPDLAAAARDEIAEAGGAHPLNDKLTDVFTERSKWVKSQLDKAAAAG
ncbi:type II toxin-antitoxin system HipA family toxin [Caulobacter sp. Root1472]|uniref:type II toxin-antitoxin system HipA family toxin n=1 Tax=Caulobacter sp. Root1472 TaxID=1736470 RepID=UPI0012E38783|nr:type II toxin-antitoxin system HipA family toxin [Caulobacter sp. Root1472]